MPPWQSLAALEGVRWSHVERAFLIVEKDSYIGGCALQNATSYDLALALAAPGSVLKRL